MANLLLITNGSGGDVIPFINLGRILKNDGHDVSIFTHCIYRESIEKNGLRFIPTDEYDEYKERSEKISELSDPINKSNEYLEFNVKYFGADRIYKEYRIISEYCKRKDTVILCRHRFGLAGLLAAEKCGCPVASIITAPNYVQHLDVHEQLIGKTMKDEVNKARSKIGLNSISNWTEWMCSPRLKLALWPEWYGEQELKAIEGMVSVGFIANEGEEPDEMSEDTKQSIIKFIGGGKKSVLITAGTSKMVNPNLLKVAVESSGQVDVNGIVVTPYDDFLPNTLPKNIMRINRAPIKEIMPYVNAVIHHGGLGTASEAIALGIPQLIMPHMVDRPDNAEKLRNLGVAKMIPVINWKVDVMAKTINEIVNDEEMLLTCKKLADKIKIDDFKKKLCLAVNKLSEAREDYKVYNIYKDSRQDENTMNYNINSNSRLNCSFEKKKKMLAELLKKKHNEKLK